MISFLVDNHMLELAQNIEAEGVEAKTNYEAGPMQEPEARAAALSTELLTSLAQTLSKSCLQKIEHAATEAVPLNVLPNLVSHMVVWTIGAEHLESKGAQPQNCSSSHVLQAMGTIDTFEHEFLSEFIVALSDTSTKLCEEDFASSGYNNDNPKVCSENATHNVEIAMSQIEQETSMLSVISAPDASSDDKERAVREMLSAPEFSLIEIKKKVVSQLRVQHATSAGLYDNSLTSMPAGLSAVQPEDLAASVAILTHEAVESCLLLTKESPQEGSILHSIFHGRFTRGACFPAGSLNGLQLLGSSEWQIGQVASHFSIHHNARCAKEDALRDATDKTALQGTSTFENHTSVMPSLMPSFVCDMGTRNYTSRAPPSDSTAKAHG